MTARRAPRLAAALAAAAGMLAAAAGCGVPTSSDVQHIGPGPEAGAQPRDEGQPPPPADAATTPGDLVDNFLQAPAGNPQTAADRAAEFIHSDERAGWQPDDQIRVVRLRQEPFISDDIDGGWTVELSVQAIGELHPNGYLDSSAGVEPVEYDFRVVTEGVEPEMDGRPVRLRIADPPPYLLLEDRALANRDYFYPHPIYFWDTDHTTLVPDLRWLPLAGEPTDQHPWNVVRWLLAGPAPGLARTEGLPAGTQHHGAPVWEGDRLVVNVNAVAVEGQDVDDLATQLAWSLLPLRGGGAKLELRIDDRPQEVRPAPRPEPGDPVGFALLDGVARQQDDSALTGLPPVLADEDLNQQLEVAAVTSDGDGAALVRTTATGNQRLTVVRATGGDEPAAETTGLTGSVLGRPVWLQGGPSATGLVVADGELHWFRTDGQVEQVAVAGLAGPVQSVAVSPERRRLALVAGDRLYMAQVRHERESVTVHAPRALPTTLQGLAGVAFTHEYLLVVAGEKDGRVGLHELTVDGVDGAVERPRPLRDLGNATVSRLVAHPRERVDDLPMIMYEANGQAYSFTGAPDLIRPEDLVDSPDNNQAPPYAPFFLG